MNRLLQTFCLGMSLAFCAVFAASELCTNPQESVRFCIAQASTSEGTITFFGNTKKTVSCPAEVKGGRWTAKCQGTSTLAIDRTVIHEESADLVFRVGRYKNPETQADSARITIEKQPHGLFRTASFVVD